MTTERTPEQRLADVLAVHFSNLTDGPVRERIADAMNAADPTIAADMELGAAIREEKDELLLPDEPTRPDDHETYCDYRKRNPAVERDCDCGRYRAWRDLGLEIAERLAALLRATEGEKP